MFFGLNGRTQDEDGQLTGLGVIYYDYACVERFKADLGDNFSWRKKEEEVVDEIGEEVINDVGINKTIFDQILDRFRAQDGAHALVNTSAVTFAAIMLASF